MIGREEEKRVFESILEKKTASLVTVRGRRRIGKSTFVEEMGKRFDYFFEFQGLAPGEGVSNKKQLSHFAKLCKKNFKGPDLKFDDWSQAFDYLAEKTKTGKTLLFLDEISWMGRFDSDFSGKLKIAWDLQFKKNPHLVLVLCGSVSSWIKKNILNNTGFVGRISLDLRLDELSMKESLELAGLNKKTFSSMEKLRFLAFTGGVPKYLEEIIAKNGPENNIERLCLHPSGALHNEFEHIFNDIFESKSLLYKKIISELVEKKSSAKELSIKLGLPLNGDLTDHLDNLIESGFVSKECSWGFDSLSQLKQPLYRLSDNYLRFYLKYIKKNVSSLNSFTGKIKNFDSIIGLQFENLVYKNYKPLCHLPKIDPLDVVHIGPYLQKKNSKQAGVQCDLIIQTKFKTIYLCEIKARHIVDAGVIEDVRIKMDHLKIKKGFGLRKVLIYAGDLASSLTDSDFFDYVISFDDLIKE